jgi:AcrR family transcriptional regulator
MKTSRDDIVERAFPVFLEKGLDGASMADLVHASGLSKGAFYYYFPDKASLFDACVDRFFSAYLPSPIGTGSSMEAGAGAGAAAYLEELWMGYAAALAKAREACADASAYLRFLLSVLPLRRQAMKAALSAGIAALAERLLAEGYCTDPAAAEAEAESLTALIEGAGVLAAVSDDGDLEERFRRLLGNKLNDARKAARRAC